MKNIKKILVTGITGYIGGTIAVKLKEKGYEVSGLVRKDSDIEKLQSFGFDTFQGSLEDKELLSKIIENSDAVIHTADSDTPEVAYAFLDILKNTGKTFIYTSGSSIVANWDNPKTADFVYTEDFPLVNDNSQRHRVVINDKILAAAIDGVRSIVMVPSMVYGDGLLLNKESKQLPVLIQTAKSLGRAAYVGNGLHAWSHVHVEDLADLYILALEKSPAGTLYFAENGIANFKQIAETIQSNLELQGAPKSLSAEEAAGLWGEMMATVALGSDCRMSSYKAKSYLGWSPSRSSVTDWIAAAAL